MDVVTHAVIGFSVGLTYDMPITGAFFAILPDISLVGKRKAEPDALYVYSHSTITLALTTVLVFLFFNSNTALTYFWAYASHILIDVFTHNGVWATRLFYPFSMKNFRILPEWEFFNKTWWFGLTLTLAFIVLWHTAHTL